MPGFYFQIWYNWVPTLTITAIVWLSVSSPLTLYLSGSLCPQWREKTARVHQYQTKSGEMFNVMVSIPYGILIYLVI